MQKRQQAAPKPRNDVARTRSMAGGINARRSFKWAGGELASSTTLDQMTVFLSLQDIFAITEKLGR
jgi:hypothetical protein